MKISTRLMMLGGVMSALLLLIGGLGLYGISAANEDLRTVYEERTVPAEQLGDIGSRILDNQLALSAALITPTPEALQASTAKVDANIAAINKTLELYTAGNLSPEEAQLARTFGENRKQFVDGLKPALDALRDNDIIEGQNIFVNKLPVLYKPVKEGIDTLARMQVEGARLEYARAKSRFNTIRTVFIVAILGGVLFISYYGYVLARSITRQLGAEPYEAKRLARSVGSGDLTVSIHIAPGDQKSLMAQLGVMQQNLTDVVSRVRNSAESVAAASGEIEQGNYDLSSRTEEQASALEETAASMEELSSTVKQNADSARQANQLALSASTVAIKGGEVMEQVVDTMRGINESSRKISDIIGVIDGIAFQTNILALNAAVEAARAGEQGRGFAVVASEVRSLAQRSAEAAKEIKSLINASVERVEHGNTLVDQAGTTMNEVVTSIKRVTDIMGEISSASSEQSLGVSQVGDAIGQMDRTTQQNAALVEEMAAATSSLKVQANDLVQAMSVFKLAHDQAASASLSYSAAPSPRPAARADKVSARYTPSKTALTGKPRALSAPTHAAAKPAVNPRPASAAKKPAPPSAKPPADESDNWETF